MLRRLMLRGVTVMASLLVVIAATGVDARTPLWIYEPDVPEMLKK